jgi:hypothetical protein
MQNFRFEFLNIFEILVSATGAYAPMCQIKFQPVLKKDNVFLGKKKFNMISFDIV